MKSRRSSGNAARSAAIWEILCLPVRGSHRLFATWPQACDAGNKKGPPETAGRTASGALFCAATRILSSCPSSSGGSLQTASAAYAGREQRHRRLARAHGDHFVGQDLETRGAVLAFERQRQRDGVGVARHGLGGESAGGRAAFRQRQGTVRWNSDDLLSDAIRSRF